MNDILFAIMTMHFDAHPAFEKECKRLEKKYLSLAKDLEEFKKVISVIPLGNGKHFNIIKDNDSITILKARLFCRYLKGSSLRIIYSYKRKTNHITFIELYFKGEKENEDRERIEEYTKHQSSL
jgi:mRNA-degrading endonuclease RelE of RelBE toxin-antitoxin system